MTGRRLGLAALALGLAHALLWSWWDAGGSVATPTWTDSPLLAGLLAVLGWFGMPELVSTRVIGLAAAEAGISLAWALGRLALGDRWAGVPAVLLAASPIYARWVVEGGEGALLATLLLAALLRLALEAEDRDRLPLSAGLLALLALTAPEAAVLAPMGLLVHWRAGRPLGAYALVGLAPALAVVVARWMSGGGASAAVPDGLLWAHAGLLPFAGAGGWSPRLERRLLAGSLALWGAAVAFFGGAEAWLEPIAVLLAVLAGVGAVDLSRRLDLEPGWLVAAAVAAVALPAFL